MLTRSHRGLFVTLLALATLAATLAALYLFDQRLHDWLLSPATKSAQIWLGRFLRWIVPLLFFLHIALGLVNARQQRTPIQASMTRFLFVKASFWGVFWLNFHIRQTWLWLILDVVTLCATLASATDLGIRLLNRYVFVRRDRPIPHPLRLDPS